MNLPKSVLDLIDAALTYQGTERDHYIRVAMLAQAEAVRKCAEICEHETFCESARIRIRSAFPEAFEERKT